MVRTLTPPLRVVCSAFTFAGAGQSGMMQCIEQATRPPLLRFRKRVRGQRCAYVFQQICHVFRQRRMPFHPFARYRMFQAPARGVQGLARESRSAARAIAARISARFLR